MTTTLKTCFKCQESKPFSEFYPHKMMGDGYLGKCKDCTKRDVAEHRSKNLARAREYDRMRYRRDAHRQEQLKALADRQTPNQLSASRKLWGAIQSGRVIKPEACWCCGSKDWVEAHHASYDKGMELAVTWLCRSCHCKCHAHTPKAA